MDAKYICQNWQALLQMLVYLTSRGYHSYCLITLPEAKKDRWVQIDKKLITRYQTSKSKFQRARQKLKKQANFYYLRWDSIAIILHTTGDKSYIEYLDQFAAIHSNPLYLKISDLITFTISISPQIKPNKKDEIKEKVSVRLYRDTYRGLKDVLADIASSKNKELMKNHFNRINGLPAYSSIITQKKQLAQFLVRQAQKHQTSLKKSELRINTKLKKYKVFCEE